jgi:hypothetical protein
MSMRLPTLGPVTEPPGPASDEPSPALQPAPETGEPPADHTAPEARTTAPTAETPTVSPSTATAYPLPPGWPVPPGWTVLTVPGDPRTFVLPPPGTTAPDAPTVGLRHAVPIPPPVGVSKGRKVLGRLLGVSLASTLVLGVAVASALFVAGWLTLKVWGFEHLGATGTLVLTAFLVTGGHTAVSLWGAQKRPVRWWAIGVTQVPFLAAYVVAVAWYHSRGVNVDQTGFPPLYILWTAAALAALAGLIIWYTRNPQPPKRAIAFLTACAVLVLVNGLAIFTIAWRNTNGLGLIGPPTPWEAFEDLTVTSCISNSDFYFYGSKELQANCPSGPNADLYAGIHDDAAFDQLLCDDQPRAAFDAWWNRSRHYQIAIGLDFGYPDQWTNTVDGKPAPDPLPGQIDGSQATIAVTVELKAAFRIGGPDDQAHPMRVDKADETWNVHLQHQTFGGWKVCRIDVPNPIKDHPASLDPKPSPTPSPTDDLGRGQLASSLPCGPLDPFRQYHHCPSDSPSPSQGPTTPPSPTPGPTTS